MTNEQEQQLRAYILSNFSTAFELNAWLVNQIWPAYKAKSMELRAEKRKADYLARKAAKDTSPISDRFRALDGTPITDKQLERAAKKGEPLLEIATGQPKRFLWRIKGKLGRWVPLDYKGSF